MARTHNIKRFLWRKGSPLHYIQWSLPAGVCLSSHHLTEGGGGLCLSLSPMVTDPTASRPLAEREDVHCFSVRRR